MFVYVFFFQAEDGIRDLVRSRGLGDVYKRQALCLVAVFADVLCGARRLGCAESAGWPSARRNRAVSYTHPTLPTSDLV